MRLLIVSAEFPPGPGGIGTHAYQIARYFSKQKALVQVLAMQDYASQQDVNRFNGQQDFDIKSFTPHKYQYQKFFGRLFSLHTQLRDFKPDIALVSGERSTWIFALAAGRKEIPWVSVGHGTEFGQKKGLRTTISRLAYNCADAVVSVSRYTQVQAQEMGITCPVHYIVCNGADHEVFEPLDAAEIADIRRQYDGSGKFVLLTVGNLTERKGQDVVIRSLPDILRFVPNVEYWLVGLPTLGYEFLTLAKSLGVEDHVRFLGRLELVDLVRRYNACDLFVMTSRMTLDGDFEGYGIAVIEAALCGKPAIVTGNSGLEEAVIDRVTGRVVPQNDPSAVANAVIELARSRDDLNRLGNQARQAAITRGTWDYVGNQYMTIMQEILRRHRAIS